jgi:hypothetical protein
MSMISAILFARLHPSLLLVLLILLVLLTLTDISFCHAALALWNSLSIELRACARNTDSFALTTPQFFNKLYRPVTRGGSRDPPPRAPFIKILQRS